MEVGVEELRNNLTATSIECVMAMSSLSPTAGEQSPRRTGCRERVLDRLIAEGIVTPGRSPKRPTSTPIKTKGVVSDLVGEQCR